MSSMVNKAKMNKMDKISIIIPAYNSAETIGRCVDSALSQSYSNIEVIVIDDGSSDDTVKICKRYTCDHRFTILSQENAGPSSARNRGICLSTGNWIMFIDSDDFVSPEICSRLYALANEDSLEVADMVFCNLINIFNDGKTTHMIPLIGTKRVYKGDEVRSLEYMLVGKESETGEPLLCLSGPVCKLIRKKSIENIKFPEHISLGEDTCFVLEVLQRCNKVIYSNEELYFRNIRGNSLSYSGVTGERLSAYTNWILRKYYNDKMFRGAAVRLNILNLCWIMQLELGQVDLPYIDAKGKVTKYKQLIERSPTLLERLKCKIDKKTKTIVLLEWLKLYKPVWLILTIRNRIRREYK